ncbi:MAG TPA: radical SAM family heme chaperone HemW [Gemmatimonadaceae bacterium]|nr:radical SAM family heme chaperone HemW [Gemmatimonadaceae bacterium]
MPAHHLYVHVPFCARRCSYCDFSIAVRAETPVDEYLGALRSELALASHGGVLGELQTVYVGGGTPSRLGGEGIARLLSLIREHVGIVDGAEVTIEANPDDVTPSNAQAWARSGVNRVSVGVQSFNDRVLAWMHRTHDSTQPERAVQALRAAGLVNYSLDVIFALPAHLQRDLRVDLAQLLALEPAHVSIYGLTVESHTPLAHWASRGDSVEGSEETYEQDFLLAHEQVTAAGFEHYEVSNFALPGKRSRHNSIYWSGQPYAALGPAAHSYDGNVRRWNVRGYAQWVRTLAEGKSPIEAEEELTAENRISEEVYLGLRTNRGLETSAAELERARPWIAAGWARSDGTTLVLTPTGWLRLDSLAADLAAHRSAEGSETLRNDRSRCYI